ncbi:ATP-binding cassette transporter [Clavulina sp. PMI_390]|nr:ATP-binding cassette transporter [Clavulina sp. PMI_390]
MLPFKWELSVVLLVVGLISAVVLVLARPTSVKLNLDSDYEPLGGASDDVQHDPFDVLQPEDAIDGYPIQPEKFWKTSRTVKLVLSVSLTLVVAFDAFALGYHAINISRSERNETVASALRLSLDLYTLYLAVCLVAINDTAQNWICICHVSALTAASVALRTIPLILPSNPFQARPELHVEEFRGLEWAALASLLVSCIITSNIPSGPPLHYPPSQIYSPKILESFNVVPQKEDNVCAVVQATVVEALLFNYTTCVANLSHTSESLEVRDLPIVPAIYRAANLFAKMRSATVQDEKKEWARLDQRLHGKKAPKRWFWQNEGSGFPLIARLARINAGVLAIELSLAAVTAVMYYIPLWFLQRFIQYLEDNPNREEKSWGWIYLAGLFFFNAMNWVMIGQLWSIATTQVNVALKVELNTILFAKTLLRKNIAASPSSIGQKEDDSVMRAAEPTPPDAAASTAIHSEEPIHTPAVHETAPPKDDNAKEKDKEPNFSNKSQIMTLMTIDVDRVADFSWHLFNLIDAPIEIIIGTFYLYKLLGSSCFLGLLVTCLFLPMNHFASKIVVVAQDNLMKARDERVSLTNEVLGGIRMLKFMAWERNFEARVLKIRNKELKYQKRNYIIEVCFNAVWEASPILVTVVAFWHFTVIRHQYLSPSIAFTSLGVFNELKFALNALPETFINMLQGFVSLRRIENYLASPEVSPAGPMDSEESTRIRIAMQSATTTWPQARVEACTRAAHPSTAAMPNLEGKFVLRDINVTIPMGELTLVCGKLGSGKSLFLLSLLGESDVLGGQIICPRTPPKSLAAFSAMEYIDPRDWVVPGVVAYVPQTAWLQNISIRDNILFGLPFDERRYYATLEACALVADLKIIEDGDEAEIGERGINLSGGQKARVSLARAIYSRASILLLDDVLSAVDAHTARHIFDKCLKGPLVAWRTVVLVSHHVQLCAIGASYVIALDNGALIYAGSREGFLEHNLSFNMVRVDEDIPAAFSSESDPSAERDTAHEGELEGGDSSTIIVADIPQTSTDAPMKMAPKKYYDEEKRAVGRIAKDIWLIYIHACGSWRFWLLFASIFVLTPISLVFNNLWLSIWSSAPDAGEHPLKYVGIYALINFVAIIISTLRWLALYKGSITASTTLHKKLLEGILFAKIRFHDTVSRGRLLNRFGKDLETIDSKQADNFGRAVISALNVCITVMTVTVVGGPGFLASVVVLGILYYRTARTYGQTSRDMRRLDSVTRSPLYSMYGETIAGVTIVRAFGASTKFLRDMHRHVDTNGDFVNPYFWMQSLNRWLAIRFNLLSAAVIGSTGVVILLNKDISAAMAGFALVFASNITSDMLFMARRFVGLEQSMVALERVNEYSNLPREASEYIEPRPPTAWPQEGKLDVEDLVIRYAPDLPDVLHDISFTVEPGSKIGVLGRTGGGKSTLALSFFRFVEATQGKIVIDGVDIAQVGLTDLRSRLTIIPQDPTILSGTLRSTLDVFEEYEDAEIFEALRRVHLIPSDDSDDASTSGNSTAAPSVNANVFRNLDSPVSEGGDNFSAGEKQLICMARAILKKSRVLLMDEATASVDYATDELISRTIRREFAESWYLGRSTTPRSVPDANCGLAPRRS